ncbi:TssQ family T6SS-associated lipoprotein [Aquabacterium sp.]|uniref:TssQ family T6SS-associated lipoprotein n=1 Tax=Aquabacterium sp. TaxID=1872578 RepID=UPI0019AED37D|nr:TssQ family T6SS-associated lipoprotein [Aquabacterium sp.]MBC7699961.1 TssQ family T6SS-associated lipoprotein [Aquabacterium sp.]
MRIHAHFAFHRLTTLLAVLMLSACTMPPKDAPQPPKLVASAPAVPVAAPAPTPVVTAADAALAQGLKAYQAAQYTTAETQFNTALQAGLTVPADVATAHKHLAFIYCTSRRETACAKAFKAARAADPGFALSKAEAGHPMWGPVYRKALPVVKPASTPAKKGAAVKPQP